MSHSINNWKTDIIYSTISAIFYTLLYFILSLLKPGPGFQESMIARFAFMELLSLAFLLFASSLVPGFFALSLLYGLFTSILSKFGISDNDACYFSLGWIISIPTILFFAIALGFVSIGGM